MGGYIGAYHLLTQRGVSQEGFLFWGGEGTRILCLFVGWAWREEPTSRNNLVELESFGLQAKVEARSS